MDLSSRAIGVFDSGVGGLTVLRALCDELPCEQFVYLGDTARLPYGTKSADTVVRYALQAADTLVLGCTHFPALRPAIREVIGDQVTIVDSAAATARAAHRLLQRGGLLRAQQAAQAPELSFLATDSVARFASIGSRFLARDIDVQQIELVDL